MKNQWKSLAIAGCGAVFAAAFASVVALHLGGDQFTSKFDILSGAGSAFVAAASCLLAARRSLGQFRRGWAFLSASTFAWGLGQVVASAYGFAGEEAPFPSAADAGFLVSVPLAIIGVISFWTNSQDVSARGRVWIDGLIIVSSLTFTAWGFGLNHVIFVPTSVFARAIALAYPAGDILLATALILAIRRATHYQQGRMLLLLAGLGVKSIADVVFTYGFDTVDLGATQSVVSSAWVAAYLMIALSAIWPAGRIVAAARAPIDLVQLALPWIGVLGVGLTGVAMQFHVAQSDGFTALLGSCLAALLIASVILAQKDSLSMLVKSRVSEEALAEVIAHAPIGIVRADKDFKVIDANPSLLAMFRASRDVMIGSTVAKYLPDEVQPEVFGKLRALMTGASATVEAESPMVRADLSPLWGHWTSTAVRKANGELDYFLTMLEDATARHEAEITARASLDALERLNAVKSEFIQSVSHEFKTALIGIQGFSEYMRDMDELDINDVRAFATDIHKDAERLDRIVTEMLALDTAESGRTSLVVEAVDLNAIIDAEVRRAKTEAHDVVIEIKDTSRPIKVTGDADRLSEVVRTLLRNAIKYSPERGEIVVSTRVHDGLVEVTVSDQGSGIRADFDNRLFGRDELYANNPIRKIVGTGLGLGIARKIVEMHGGRIWIVRLDGAGSELHFTVPEARVQTAASQVA